MIKIIIKIGVSALGAYFSGYDFFVLYTLIEIGISLSEPLIEKPTNDKSALQKQYK